MEDYDFEMPTPCQHCGEIFDLNDGFGSEKWYPNTVICEECYRKEEAEIEEDDRWEDINNEISNALYGLDKEEGAWAKITDENRALIIQLVVQHSELLSGLLTMLEKEGGNNFIDKAEIISKYKATL